MGAPTFDTWVEQYASSISMLVYLLLIREVGVSRVSSFLAWLIQQGNALWGHTMETVVFCQPTQQEASKCLPWGIKNKTSISLILQTAKAIKVLCKKAIRFTERLASLCEQPRGLSMKTAWMSNEHKVLKVYIIITPRVFIPIIDGAMQISRCVPSFQPLTVVSGMTRNRTPLPASNWEFQNIFCSGTHVYRKWRRPRGGIRTLRAPCKPLTLARKECNYMFQG